MFPTEFSVAQSVSATMYGITLRAWRWFGPPVAS
jgi:hypothetical protein